jgi:hypothetical protein
MNVPATNVYNGVSFLDELNDISVTKGLRFIEIVVVKIFPAFLMVPTAKFCMASSGNR